MTKIKVKCSYCDNEFERSQAEVKRSLLLNRRLFCSRRCCGLGTNDADSIKRRIPHEKIIEGSIKANSKRSDELSPFRYYHHIIRNRLKRKCRISLEQLKEQWDKQEGLCPYTGVKLILPLSTIGFRNKLDKLHNASLDRVDSSKEYQLGNVQFVSWMANVAKNDVDDKMMQKFCNAICENWRDRFE